MQTAALPVELPSTRQTSALVMAILLPCRILPRILLRVLRPILPGNLPQIQLPFPSVFPYIRMSRSSARI